MSGEWYTTWGFWVGVAGVVIGLAGLFYGGWARSHPKRSSLVGRISESALMPDVATADQIRVTMDGYQIVEPHLVRITLTNLGPADLTPSAFEGGHLRCVTPAPSPQTDAALMYTMVPVALLHASAPCQIVYPESTKSETIGIEISPSQIRAGESITVTALIAGKPDFSWDDRLAGFALQTLKGEKPADFRLTIEVPVPFLGILPVTWRRVRM